MYLLGSVKYQNILEKQSLRKVAVYQQQRLNRPIKFPTNHQKSDSPRLKFQTRFNPRALHSITTANRQFFQRPYVPWPLVTMIYRGHLRIERHSSDPGNRGRVSRINIEAVAWRIEPIIRPISRESSPKFEHCSADFARGKPRSWQRRHSPETEKIAAQCCCRSRQTIINPRPFRSLIVISPRPPPTNYVEQLTPLELHCIFDILLRVGEI